MINVTFSFCGCNDNLATLAGTNLMVLLEKRALILHENNVGLSRYSLPFIIPKVTLPPLFLLLILRS